MKPTFSRSLPQRIEITGNANPGLLHGVQSLLQLLRLKSGGAWSLPEAEIEDWPALPLRFIHWDTKHHQDRPETLKRFIDWASFFKVNAIGFEIEDKYEFPRHPVVGAPGAFTKAEMQELTRYALERHIQLVPQIQAPAHMAYVLKHEEFKHLRADGSNYQACMCDEEAISLIQDLYQDMIDATPGVEYFHVSTDEVYFAGICDKCQAKRPYNDKNRSLTWVEYVNRMHKWLADRGRKMLCWVEYPLLEEHLAASSQGVDQRGRCAGSKRRLEQGTAGRRRRIAHLQPPAGFRAAFPQLSSRLNSRTTAAPFRAGWRNPARWFPRLLARSPNELIGTFAAAWDDSGLHNETFWLGWVMVSQYGWSPERAARRAGHRRFHGHLLRSRQPGNDRGLPDAHGRGPLLRIESRPGSRNTPQADIRQLGRPGTGHDSDRPEDRTSSAAFRLRRDPGGRSDLFPPLRPRPGSDAGGPPETGPGDRQFCRESSVWCRETATTWKSCCRSPGSNATM